MQIEQTFHPINPVVDEDAHEGPRGYAHALKHGESFVVLDERGDINGRGAGHQGLFRGDCRYLSRLSLVVGGNRPTPLHTATRRDNHAHITDLLSPPLPGLGGTIEAGAVHIAREASLSEGVYHETLTLSNHAGRPVELPIAYVFAADYCDMFEIRGFVRDRRGDRLEPRRTATGIVFRYRGLDDVLRETRVHFKPAPGALSADTASFRVPLEAGARRSLRLAVECREHRTDDAPVAPVRPFTAGDGAGKCENAPRCRIETSSDLYNAWLERSAADLDMLTTRLPSGRYPFAGLPWFSAVFGRDGIVAALQTLAVDPGLARGVLATLAEFQATELDEARAAEPGKIIHELHHGELANLGAVPFARYYGTADATPLFVILAGAYYRVSLDRPFLESIWPHVDAAIRWMDEYGDRDGDGFIEYRQSPEGLLHQGWKDSPTAVFHRDGHPAEGTIALCEVQAYAYAARLEAAYLASCLGRQRRAETLRTAARSLGERFDAAYWSGALGAYAFALDGDKQPCLTESSNAGHALFAGIAPPDKARRLAARLTTSDFYSGWGIRTIATGSARYNPASYHNGSVWPHDTAMIAVGLRRYGEAARAAMLFRSMAEAASALERHRLPEVLCGFAREADRGPTPYPSACAPQAWAAGAGFMLLTASIGLTVDAAARRVVLRHPVLPANLDEVVLRDLPVGDTAVSLAIYRRGDSIATTLLGRRSGIELVAAQ